MTTDESNRDATHLVPLGANGWSVWRTALLRTTGFPAAGLDRLAAPHLATVADRFLDDAVDRDRLVEAFETSAVELSTEIDEIAGDRRLREAITWQNPSLVALLDSLLRSGPPAPRKTKRRYREKQLSRLWQRYCGKAETIGFFGPGCWVEVDGDEPRGLIARPGDSLLERRHVALEPWAVAVYGEEIAADPAIRRWMPPVRFPHHVVDGRLVFGADLPVTELSAAEAAALDRADGSTPATVVARDLVADQAFDVEDEAAAFAVLDGLVSRRLLKWDANLPIAPHIEEVLGRRIAAIDDAELRTRASEGFDRLCRGRDTVAKAAGDPEALAEALAALDETFVELTGRAPRRRAGQAYAGRNLCYEDTSRALDVVVGRRVLDAVAAPLEIVGRVGRWFTAELAKACEDALAERYAEVSASDDRTTLADLWDAGVDFCLNARSPRAAAVTRALGSRWHELLGPSAVGDGGPVELRSGELMTRIAELFPAERPGWSSARIHSPDIHVCAPSADAVGRGEFFVVLGEVHIAAATLCDRWCTWSMDDPTANLATAIADHGQSRVVPLLPGVWSRDAGRNVQIEDHPSDLYLGFARAPGVDGRRTVPIGAVPVAMVDGRLMASLPDGTARPLVELFAHFLSLHAVNMLRLVSPPGHSPRVTIDRLVVARERWLTSATELRSLVNAKTDLDQYLEGRRLVRRLGLPERCFVKIATERKPIYVDFSSSLYVASLCTMLRAAESAAVEFSEMLPTPDHTWVTDAEGQRYFGEFRIHCVDPEPAR